MAYNQRGLDSHQEQSQSKIIRDTRTLGMRVKDTLKNQVSLSIVMLVCATTCFILGYLSEIILVIGMICFFYGFFQKRHLPFRMPLVSHEKDFNDISPTGKPHLARGIYYFGNEIKTTNELWFSNVDMRTHVLIFGSTGSGKTQALLGITYNALLQASGFIYVDGKGDNSLYASTFLRTNNITCTRHKIISLRYPKIKQVVAQTNITIDSDTWFLSVSLTRIPNVRVSRMIFDWLCS